MACDLRFGEYTAQMYVPIDIASSRSCDPQGGSHKGHLTSTFKKSSHHHQNLISYSYSTKIRLLHSAVTNPTLINVAMHRSSCGVCCEKQFVESTFFKHASLHSLIAVYLKKH